MNGYTKINIQGQEVGLKFAHLSHTLFIEAYIGNEKYYSIGNTFNEVGWGKLFHCAYLNNCVIKEVTPTLQLEAFVDWVEEAVYGGNEELKAQFVKAGEVWMDSRAAKEVIQKAQELSQVEGEKKGRKKKESLTIVS